jgi:hypothetical protein
VALPKGVHRVIARSREYFYFQANRGTPQAGPRIGLPRDPHSPDFWIALRAAQGIEQTAPAVMTMGVVCDLYEAWPMFAKLSPNTQRQYRYSLKIVRTAWGDLPAAGVRPVHVQALMDQLAATPGTANNVLGLPRFRSRIRLACRRR